MMAANYTQTSLATEMGITPQAVQQWIAGQTAPRGKRLEKLANVLGVSLNWLITGKQDADDDEILIKGISCAHPDYNVIESNKTKGKVPLISFVKAGDWCEAIDNYTPGDAEQWLDCPSTHGPHTYALRVVGDSMTSPYPGKISYPEGVIIYVDPDHVVISGCRVIAKLPNSNDVTFKEYREENGKRYLKPLNPQYPLMEISDDTRFCGVIIGQYIPE